MCDFDLVPRARARRRGQAPAAAARRRFRALGLAALAWFLAGAAQAADLHAMLATADAYRLAAGEVEVQTQILLLRDGAIDKERRYRVLLKPGHRSLVISESPAEQGQKVLMLDEDFWIILPSSQRPVRITPAQKLLGEAAAGDIASMTWSDDYDGRIVGEAERDGQACVQLDLVARRASASYRRVVLFVATGGEPVAADLYLASDKLAKEAHFEMGQLRGRRQVVRMRLVDRIQAKRVTEVRYLDQQPRPVADTLFNPMYLTHSDLR